jgi:hypothetical protein
MGVNLRDGELAGLIHVGPSLTYLERLAEIIDARTCGGGSFVVDEIYAVDMADKLRSIAIYWRGYIDGSGSRGR